MGQQQLLLIVLGVIIVGVAIVAGIGYLMPVLKKLQKMN
jgi:hypothetical protein